MRMVRAEWDTEAAVWVATSDDVPGLATEAETLEALSAKLERMVPELLETNGMENLRGRLVSITLAWERAFGNAPHITAALSEYDAARLVGCSVDSYSRSMQGVTAVQKGYDFIFNGARYQVKANRPSGKRGSRVTLVPKAKNYDWDYLIWILYDSQYQIQEAWQWEVSAYRNAFDNAKRLSPVHLRLGKQLVTCA